MKKWIAALSAAAMLATGAAWADEHAGKKADEHAGEQAQPKEHAGKHAQAKEHAGKHAMEKRKYDDRYYLGLMWNYIDADKDERDVEDSSGIRLLLGRNFSRSLALEASLSYNDFDRSDRPIAVLEGNMLEQEEWSLGIDALAFPFKCATCLRPFLKAGIGVTTTEDTAGGDEDTTGFNVNLGTGVHWKLNSHGLALKADVSHRWLFWGDDRGDNGKVPDEWIGGLGVIYPFGDAPKLYKPKSCKKRHHHHHPHGHHDKMDGPMKGERDSDGDGVPDRSDRCPGTPAGTPVDEFGCPLQTAERDDDKDGVPNSRDRCPNTPAGAKVDVNGCPLPETVVIYFAFDSSELNSAARSALDRVAANLDQRKFVVAIANGHADRTGTEEYNMGLSQRRADAVADYLASKGVARSQIRTRAYGETRPAADNSTEMGRAKNRRVEINLLRQ